MRAVLQLVTKASVTVDGDRTAAIGPGLMVLLGVTHEDGDAEARFLAGNEQRGGDNAGCPAFPYLGCAGGHHAFESTFPLYIGDGFEQ